MMSMRCDAVRVLLAENAGCGATGYVVPKDGRKANTGSRSCENDEARVIPSRKGERGAGDERVGKKKTKNAEPNAVENRNFYM